MRGCSVPMCILALQLRLVCPAEELGENGLCVIGCTPYIDPFQPLNGIRKYRALVDEMAETCDVLVHVGDTKSGAMPCNRTLLTHSVHILTQAAAQRGKAALFTPGDNEIADCHRHASTNVKSDIYSSREARNFLIEDLNLSGSNKDMTGKYAAIRHVSLNKKVIPGTTSYYRCEFDKYMEFSNFAVATLEVLGSTWYLADESREYPLQHLVDPPSYRRQAYINARDCALDWVHRSANRANKSGKRALFFLLHGLVYSDAGRSPLVGAANLLPGANTTGPYTELFEKLTEVAFRHKNLMVYVIHGDGHRYSTTRMNPTLNNHGHAAKIQSHHNLVAHQVEGASRALTMYSRFLVDSTKLQPVTVKEEWSERAFAKIPVGHAWIPYQ